MWVRIKDYIQRKNFQYSERKPENEKFLQLSGKIIIEIDDKEFKVINIFSEEKEMTVTEYTKKVTLENQINVSMGVIVNEERLQNKT